MSRRAAPGLEALPLPGHTAGFSVYRWQGREGLYLFGGDVIFRDGQGWTAFFSHRPYAIGVESLRRLIQLDADFLLLNESLDDATPPIQFGREARQAAVGEALERVAKKYKL